MGQFVQSLLLIHSHTLLSAAPQKVHFSNRSLRITNRSPVFFRSTVRQSIMTSFISAHRPYGHVALAKYEPLTQREVDGIAICDKYLRLVRRYRCTAYAKLRCGVGMIVMSVNLKRFMLYLNRFTFVLAGFSVLFEGVRWTMTRAFECLSVA
jgi:hypothetical protein